MHPKVRPSNLLPSLSSEIAAGNKSIWLSGLPYAFGNLVRVSGLVIVLLNISNGFVERGPTRASRISHNSRRYSV